MYHTPVLLEESVKGLMITPDGTYVDATFGGGGHSRRILELLDSGRLIAFDRDPDALANNLEDQRFKLINADYRYIKNYLKLHNAIPCDGILADLGISSHQIDTAERGFSTRFSGQIDMRMDKRTELSAIDVLNTYSEHELMDIFRRYGEIKNSHKLAGAIVRSRKDEQIRTTRELKEIAVSCTPRQLENKYLSQVFQAIRIEVNKELESLEIFLEKSLEVLKPGGRLVIISYHSLEDRLVKNFFRSGNLEGRTEQDFYGNIQSSIEAITRKPIIPGEEEIEANPRARSAKLRIAVKKQP
ncbi:MAG: 16S rRNA (cytosine(1402)-N(4))-methyltransferase RsmH [Bacteroidales bacterium]|jgi:16S rRNA (cytosine1402-N4)-methyltransferase|nr:16S rRNA (cytosine(1402)-N(4))-methyltransferase RsmH [Bacteroidales bacterium]